MYAVVDINGFQYRIEKGETLRVPKYDLEVGAKITMSEVLLLTDGERVEVGTPFVDGAEIEATVVGQGKDRKSSCSRRKGAAIIRSSAGIVGFHRNRRQRYRLAAESASCLEDSHGAIKRVSEVPATAAIRRDRGLESNGSAAKRSTREPLHPSA